MSNTIVNTLSQKIPEEYIKVLEIRNRPKLSYVPIDKTIRFLNEHLGDKWNVSIEKVEWISSLPLVPTVLVHVILSITNGEEVIYRAGIGADRYTGKEENFSYAFDPDKLVKTAYANAVKKAANMFGFALELWDEANIPISEEQKEYNLQKAAMPKKEEAHQSNDKPASLSNKSREAFKKLKTETGFTDAELTEFLIKFKPESKGNPNFFVGNNEDTLVKEFIGFVSSEK